MSSYSESTIYPTHTSNTSQLNKSTSFLVTNQLPGFVQDEYPKFVAFLKSYYEFLNNTNPPIEVSLILERPAGTLGTYGSDTGNYQIGETINQYADVFDNSIVTCSAIVFAIKLNLDETKQVSLFNFGGRDREFVSGYNITGQTSGAKYQIASTLVAPKASAEAATRSLLDYQDIDTTLDDYVKYIKNELAINLPENLADGVDKRKIIKHMREFYQARGTENSFKFLFRILYNEDVDIYFPETAMLRASDADWEARKTIRTTIPNVDLANTLNIPSSDSLTNREITGQKSGAKAIVKKTILNGEFGAHILELEIQNITGTFVDEMITTSNLGDGSIYQAQILSGITKTTIHDGGSNYHVGDSIGVSGGGSFASGAAMEVDETDSEGRIKSLKITDPGVRYTTTPVLDLATPHTAARFAEGPLEQIFYEDFAGGQTANGYTNTSFFSADDNRGYKSNLSLHTSVGHDQTPDLRFYGGSANPLIRSMFAKDVPITTYGLKGHWKMNAWSSKPIKINSRSQNVASRLYTAIPDVSGYGHHAISPRYGFEDDPINAFANGHFGGFSDYIKIGAGLFQNSVDFSTDGGVTSGGAALILRTGNTGMHSSAPDGRVGGIIGYNGLDALTGYHAKQTGSWGTAIGGLGIMDHWDIEKDQQQTWTMWYKPTANVTNSARIISRDASAYWALIINAQADGTGSSLTANSTPGGASWDYVPWKFVTRIKEGTVNKTASTGTHEYKWDADDDSRMKKDAWHFIAVQEDYVNAQTYITVIRDDGVVCTANTDLNGNWTPRTSTGLALDANSSFGSNITEAQLAAGETEDRQPYWSKRAVGIGLNIESHAKSASYTSGSTGGAFVPGIYDEGINGGAPGHYDEVRYYNRILSVQELTSLMRNPGANTSVPTLTDKGWYLLGNEFASPYIDKRFSWPYYYNELDSSDNVSGNTVFDIGDFTNPSEDTAWMVHNQNLSYDGRKVYRSKLRMRAQASGTGVTNAWFGFSWVSNTGTELYNIQGDDSYAHSDYQLLQGSNIERASIPHDTWIDLTSFMTGYRPSGALNGGNGGIDWDALYGATSNTTPWGGTAAYDFSQYPSDRGAFPHVSGAGNATRWANPSYNLNGGFFRPLMLFHYPGAGATYDNGRTLVDYFKVEAANDAFITAEAGAVMSWPGKFTGDSGKLNTSPTSLWKTNYIQDDEYYQIFSYVIKAGLGINTYKTIIEDLAHPAGTKLFGEVAIQSFAYANTVNIPETLGSEFGLLLLRFFGGHSSISEYANVPIAGKNIGYRTEFENYELGETPLGGKPGWIPYNDTRTEVNQTSPTGYSSLVANSIGHETSHVLPTKEGMLWSINGNGSFLVSANTRLPTNYDEPLGFCNPTFNIDGATNRYVRMKVRRHGPNTSSWIGRCSYEVLPNAGTPLYMQGSDEETASLHASGFLGKRDHNMILNGDMKYLYTSDVSSNYYGMPKHWRTHPGPNTEYEQALNTEYVWNPPDSTNQRPGLSEDLSSESPDIFSPTVTNGGPAGATATFDFLHFGPDNFGQPSEEWGFPLTSINGGESMAADTVITGDNGQTTIALFARSAGVTNIYIPSGHASNFPNGTVLSIPLNSESLNIPGGYSAELEIKSGGTQETNVQLYTHPVIDIGGSTTGGGSLIAPIKHGHRYRISFWARASVPRTIAVSLMKFSYNYNRYISRNGIPVGTDWQYYEYEDVVPSVHSGVNDAAARNLLSSENTAGNNPPGERDYINAELDYPSDYEEELSSLRFLLGNRPDAIYADLPSSGNTSSVAGTSTVWIDDARVTHLPFGPDEESTTSHPITANTILVEPAALQNVPAGGVGPWKILEWDMWSCLGPNLLGANYQANPDFNLPEGLRTDGTWGTTGTGEMHWHDWSTWNVVSGGGNAKFAGSAHALESSSITWRNPSGSSKIEGTFQGNWNTVKSGKINIDATEIGIHTHAIQLWPRSNGDPYSFVVKLNDTLRIQFWARAQLDRTMALRLRKHESPYIADFTANNSGPYHETNVTNAISLTSDWTKYTFYHTFATDGPLDRTGYFPTDDSTVNIKLDFELGGQTGDIYLDSLSVRKVLTTTSPWVSNKIGKMKFELAEGKSDNTGSDKFEIAWIETGSDSTKDKTETQERLRQGTELHKQLVADHTAGMTTTGASDISHGFGEYFAQNAQVGAWDSATTAPAVNTDTHTPSIYATNYEAPGSGTSGPSVMIVNPNFSTANVANSSAFIGAIPGRLAGLASLGAGHPQAIQSLKLDRNNNLWVGALHGLSLYMSNTGNEIQSTSGTDWRQMVDVVSGISGAGGGELQNQDVWGDNLDHTGVFIPDDPYNIRDIEIDDLSQDCYALNAGGTYGVVDFNGNDFPFRWPYQPQILRTLAPTIDSTNTAIGSTYGKFDGGTLTGRTARWEGMRTSTLVANTTIWRDNKLAANNRMSWGPMANSSWHNMQIQTGWKHMTYDNKDRVIYLTTTGDQPRVGTFAVDDFYPYVKANGAVWRVDSQTGNTMCLVHGLYEDLPQADRRTFFGDGINPIQQPWDVAVSPLDDHVYFTCKTSNNVFKISPARWKIPGVANAWSGLANTVNTIFMVADTTTVAAKIGSDFPSTIISAQGNEKVFSGPTNLKFSTAANTFGYLYVSCGDYSNSIVEIRPDGNTFVVANGAGFKSGSGIAPASDMLTPVLHSIDDQGSLYVAVTGSGATTGGDRVWKVETPFVEDNLNYKADFNNYTQVVNTHITAMAGGYGVLAIKPTKI